MIRLSGVLAALVVSSASAAGLDDITNRDAVSGLKQALTNGAQAAVAALPAEDNSLAAERLRGIALSHRDWLMGDGGRSRLRAQWRELFKNYDAVICPIMPTPAYRHDHSADQEARRIGIDGKDYVYPDQLAWPGIATLPGLPSTAIPTGFAPDGLPVGVQVIADYGDDAKALVAARFVEEALAR